MHLHATPNAYQQAYPAYDETPKAVIAAIAYALALRVCEDDHEAARRLVVEEWGILHQGGMVPQKPPGRLTHEREPYAPRGDGDE